MFLFLTECLVWALIAAVVGRWVFLMGVAVWFLYSLANSEWNWTVPSHHPASSHKTRSFHLQPYKHAPLADGSIRLLKLRKAEDGAIEFDLEDVRLMQFDLDKRRPIIPPYEALSYAWGPADNKWAIRCGSRQLRVTDNCYSALNRLASKTSQRPLWIDSICIDQESEAEKSQQVPLMRLVYKHALRVIIWLGEGDDRSDTAIRYLQFRACFWPLALLLPLVSEWVDRIVLQIIRGTKT